MATIPPSVLHTVLGPLFVGGMLNIALFTFEVTQVGRYFSQHPLFPTRATTRAITTQKGRRLDRPWLRFLVLWMFVLDIVASITAVAIVYIVRHTGQCANTFALTDLQYTVTGWGDIATLQSHHSYVVF